MVGTIIEINDNFIDGSEICFIGKINRPNVDSYCFAIYLKSDLQHPFMISHDNETILKENRLKLVEMWREIKK